MENLLTALLADYYIAKATTGFSPFYMMYGKEAVLPIKLSIPTWRMLKWDEVHTIEDLLSFRARQLQRRNEDMKEARLR